MSYHEMPAIRYKRDVGDAKYILLVVCTEGINIRTSLITDMTCFDVHCAPSDDVAIVSCAMRCEAVEVGADELCRILLFRYNMRN